MARRGFGDETWRLARDRDLEGLRRVADLLVDVEYDGHRARAFALAVEGRADQALAELNDGWTEEWPFPAAYAVDVARVRYLTGHYEEALTALESQAQALLKAGPPKGSRSTGPVGPPKN